MSAHAPKFTPGPWVADVPQKGDLYRYVLSNTSPIPIARLDNAGNTETEANAKLMAAAPRLYAALEAAMFSLGKHGANMEQSIGREAWLEANAALKQARGEQ